MKIKHLGCLRRSNQQEPGVFAASPGGFVVDFDDFTVFSPCEIKFCSGNGMIAEFAEFCRSDFEIADTEITLFSAPELQSYRCFQKTIGGFITFPFRCKRKSGTVCCSENGKDPASQGDVALGFKSDIGKHGVADAHSCGDTATGTGGRYADFVFDC